MELEQQTEAPFSPGRVRGIPSGSQILNVHPRNLQSHALQHIVLTGHLDIKKQGSSEPKKRKGGWPKGKKRKPPKEFSAPRAPTTGYVIFLNERRIKTKAERPDLPFTEITKMLAAQWSQLSQAGKQKYIKEAEKDKQRYMKELKAYQDSEAYQAFLERRAVHKVRTLCGKLENNHVNYFKEMKEYPIHTLTKIARKRVLGDPGFENISLLLEFNFVRLLIIVS
uniref:HMG box domain-containing protein n=1 Tax=Chrysemys picta bellii TaxID=8478 RepID=A0A8C3FDZ7_CHRPI